MHERATNRGGTRSGLTLGMQVNSLRDNKDSICMLVRRYCAMGRGSWRERVQVNFNVTEWRLAALAQMQWSHREMRRTIGGAWDACQRPFVVLELASYCGTVAYP